MVIVLKIISFSLWMIIMLFLIKGSRYRTTAHYRRLKVSAQDEEDKQAFAQGRAGGKLPALTGERHFLSTWL